MCFGKIKTPVKWLVFENLKQSADPKMQYRQYL
jgi:hypothetical protein